VVFTLASRVVIFWVYESSPVKVFVVPGAFGDEMLNKSFKNVVEFILFSPATNNLIQTFELKED